MAHGNAGKKRKLVDPPLCMECSAPARLVGGDAIYPTRVDLHVKKYWLCEAGCNAWCGCHLGPHHKPLGRPAGPELRRARSILHKEMLDPLWQNAVSDLGYEPEDEKARFMITGSARKRVYAWLAEKMGISGDDCHTAMFTIEQCRAAWVILKDADLAEIRAWAKAKGSRNA